LLHFLNDKKNPDIYIHIVFVTLFLISKFIPIYLLHMLFVLKTFLEREKVGPKELK